VDLEELEMTKTLIEELAKKPVDMAAYKDTSKAKLRELVEAKVAGKEIVAPPAVEHVQVLSLMDTLKKSVAEAKAEQVLAAENPAEARPPK
jgi:DNA end-binding protein Ku